MKLSVFYFLGILAGIGFAAIVLMIRKRRGCECHFDERQEIARGKAFKHGFFAMLLFTLAAMGAESIWGNAWMAPAFWQGLAACGGITVFAVSCIWNDAYFSIQEKPTRTFVIVGAAAAANLLNGLSHIRDGQLDMMILSLTVSAMFLVILGSVVLKMIHDRRNPQWEEE